MPLPKHRGLAGHWVADPPRTDLGSTSPRGCFKDFQNEQGPWEILLVSLESPSPQFLSFCEEDKRCSGGLFCNARWRAQREADKLHIAILVPSGRSQVPIWLYPSPLLLLASPWLKVFHDTMPLFLLFSGHNSPTKHEMVSYFKCVRITPLK